MSYHLGSDRLILGRGGGAGRFFEKIVRNELVRNELSKKKKKKKKKNPGPITSRKKYPGPGLLKQRKIER